MRFAFDFELFNDMGKHMFVTSTLFNEYICCVRACVNVNGCKTK